MDFVHLFFQRYNWCGQTKCSALLTPSDSKFSRCNSDVGVVISDHSPSEWSTHGEFLIGPSSADHWSAHIFIDLIIDHPIFDLIIDILIYSLIKSLIWSYTHWSLICSLIWSYIFFNEACSLVQSLMQQSESLPRCVFSRETSDDAHYHITILNINNSSKKNLSNRVLNISTDILCTLDFDRDISIWSFASLVYHVCQSYIIY